MFSGLEVVISCFNGRFSRQLNTMPADLTFDRHDVGRNLIPADFIIFSATGTRKSNKIIFTRWRHNRFCCRLFRSEDGQFFF